RQAEAIRRQARLQRMQLRGDGCGNAIARLLVVAANQDVRLARLGQLLQDERGGRPEWEGILAKCGQVRQNRIEQMSTEGKSAASEKAGPVGDLLLLLLAAEGEGIPGNADARVEAAARIGGVVEEGEELVILLLREGIELVIVALGAGQRQAH